MATQFPLLFSPARLGRLTVKNRIAVTAHATGLNPHSYPSEQFIAYNAEKAKNGVGLLLTMGSASVHPTSPNSDWGGIHNWDESIMPHLERMAETIKPYGTVLMAQISHRGRRANHDVTWLPVYGPSDVPEPVHRDIPHVIQKSDIGWLTEAYAAAALRLKRAGFDGVEIAAYGGHLIDQFWSPLANRRQDEYGGTLENRMRFGFEVLDAVRAAVGTDFIVGMRITGDELVEGGLTNDDMQEIALRLVATGKLDLLNVSGSVGTTDRSQALTVPSMNYPLGIFTGFAATIRARLHEAGYDIPVLASGRVVHPSQAEAVLAEGQADFVGMNRAIIADPELPKKAAEGRLDDIRMCMGANEGCIGRIYVGKPMTCVQNPVIGRERELAQVTPAREPKRVVVVGGGPGGLEAARMAALRGHRVTLFERQAVLGGQILLAARAPHRDAYQSSVTWLEGQVRKLPVELRLQEEASVEAVLALAPDAVVVATGSEARPLGVPGEEQPNVVAARAVLAGDVELRGRVLVIDENHHQEGLSTAEYLAVAGCQVTVVSRLFSAGEEIDVTTRPDLYARLDELGVELRPLTEVREIHADGSVTAEHAQSHRRFRFGTFDAFVVANKGKANDRLWHALQGRVPALFCIGDAFQPRGLHDALLEGTRAARQL